jgi:WD40 repeat protein
MLLLLLAGVAVFWSDIVRPPWSSLAPARLVGHTRLIASVKFSPDGCTLGSCGFDETIRLWDLSRWDGEHPPVPVVLPHSAVVFQMAFSNDGSTLAAVCDRKVTIWSRGPEYQRVAEITGETYHAAAFSPDGRTLALGAEDGTIRLMEMPSAREGARLRGHAMTVRTLAFSPDGKRLASGGQDGRALIWDTSTGRPSRVLIERAPGAIRSVAFSPDGRTVALGQQGSMDEAILLFDPETGTGRTRLFGHAWGVNNVVYSPDGTTLASASVDHSIKVWDLATGRDLITVKETSWLQSVSYSPDGRWLAYAGGDEVVRVLDLRGSSPTREGTDAPARNGGLLG